MPTLDFYYGSMGCGKSTYVLQLRHTLERAGFKPQLIKPWMDTRDGPETVKSRIGIEHECLGVGPDTELLDAYLNRCLGATHIIVDEAQFLSQKNVRQLAELVDNYGVQVYCFGLRTAYTGNLFEASASLMAIADNLIELPMIYKDGRKANMHIRYVDGTPVFDGNAIFVGDIDEEYESVSRREFFARKNDG